MLVVKVMFKRLKARFSLKKKEPVKNFHSETIDFGVLGIRSVKEVADDCTKSMRPEIDGSSSDFHSDRHYYYLPDYIKSRRLELGEKRRSIEAKLVDGLTIGELLAFIDSLESIGKNIDMYQRLSSQVRKYVLTSNGRLSNVSR